MKELEIKKIVEKSTDVGLFLKKHSGQLLGNGTHRDVYVFKHDPKWVIKVEKDMGELQFVNALEWHNWNWNIYFEVLNKFLAPCLTISKCGRILIQQRVKREVDGGSSNFPTHLPNWITDTKRGNFGWIGKRFVCIDYPHLINIQFRMRKSKYW